MKTPWPIATTIFVFRAEQTAPLKAQIEISKVPTPGVPAIVTTVLTVQLLPLGNIVPVQLSPVTCVEKRPPPPGTTLVIVCVTPELFVTVKSTLTVPAPGRVAQQK